MKTKIPESYDAEDWADEWLKIVNKDKSIPFDRGTMIGWFANALMRGFDEANNRRDDRERRKLGIPL